MATNTLQGLGGAFSSGINKLLNTQNNSAPAGNPLASNYTTVAGYQQALINAGWNPQAAATQAQGAQSNGYLGSSTTSNQTNATGANKGDTGGNTGSTGGNTGATGGQTGVTPPVPTKTGNPTLDAAQDAQYQYVIGSLQQGYQINPALTGTSLAAMLPQFISETATQLEPELLQNFQTEMAGVNTSLQQLSANYTASQGNSIYDFQTSLAGLLNSANPFSAGTGAAANAMATNENRSLSALDATYAANVGNTLQQAGTALGQGVPSSFLAGTGTVGLGGLSGFGANTLQAPNVNPLQVGVLGGNTVLAGSTTGGNPLNYNFNPSTYTYGSIPTAFGTNFSNLLNQQFQNYQGGAAATPIKSTTTGLTL